MQYPDSARADKYRNKSEILYMDTQITGKKRNAYILLVGKLEGKRPLGRPTHR
jgi:hypothetical protein